MVHGFAMKQSVEVSNAFSLCDSNNECHKVRELAQRSALADHITDSLPILGKKLYRGRRRVFWFIESLSYHFFSTVLS